MIENVLSLWRQTIAHNETIQSKWSYQIAGSGWVVSCLL